MLASIILICSTVLLSFVGNAANHNNVCGGVVAFAADVKADQTINDVMPNQQLQALVLYNMKEQKIVPDNFQLTDFTPDTFKTDLGKMVTLEWTPGGSEDTPHGKSDYTNLDIVNGGNGAIGPDGVNPGNYSLEGLQYATNLTKISLSSADNSQFGHHYLRGDIIDVTPLEHLTKLESLDLSGNHIRDISPIAKLPNLTELDVSMNAIENLNSLNADQYTKGFNYLDQEVFFPVKNLPSDSYTWKDIFVNKLPSNVHNADGSSQYEPYNASYISLPGNGFVTQVDNTDPVSQGHVQVFRNGAASGKQILSGDSIQYSGLSQQKQPSADNTDPTGAGRQIIHTPYTYYIMAQYSIKEGSAGIDLFPVLRFYMPYNTNVSQVSYRIIPYDKKTNQTIASYTPVEQKGMPGDKVDVPMINGYKVDDSQVDSNNQVTIPDSGGDIRVAYDQDQPQTVPYTIHPVDKQGNSLNHDVSGNAVAGAKVDVPTIDGYIVNDSKVFDNQVTIPDGGGTINVVYDKTFANETSLNVNYFDDDTNQLIQSKTIHGTIGNPYSVGTNYYPDTITINGQSYTLVKTKMPNNLTGTLSAQTAPINFYYKKATTPTPTPNPKPNPEPTPTPVNPTPVTPSNPTITTTEPAVPNKVAAKGEAVYALKKVYLYKNANFKKSERRASYVKKPRVNRPMFVVTGYKNDANGRLRYKVRDVNHLSKTAGKTGYLTANYSYVRPVYYHSQHSTLTVINPKGVNEYTKKDLTGKVKNFKQGTQLKVKGFVKHNLTTRYLLSNGHYITGNRKLVKMGKIKQPKRVVIKHKVYRYTNANFNKRNGSIAKGTKLNIKRYTFSYPTSTTKSGTKRFAVKGGYITANAKYVKVYYK